MVISKWKEMIQKEYHFSKWNQIMILLLVFVSSAVFGFIYETFFYRIDLGYFVKRGTTFGPWIPIYGFGGLLITLLTFRFKNKPFIVFLLSCLISGILEFTTGYLLFHVSGIRLWDYNTEIWNWGNVGGYICFRSVLFFGVSGLLLTYIMIPGIKWIAEKCPKQLFSSISLILSGLFILDMIFSHFI